MKNYSINILGCLALVLALSSACSSSGGDKTGIEYMPDMAHTIAYENHVLSDYSANVWNKRSTVDREKLSMIYEPVDGTIPRGYAGVHFAQDADEAYEAMVSLEGGNNLNEIAVPINGSVPYYYDNTEEERTRAMAEIIDNPFPITEEGLARGKVLYNVYCGLCHGEKADGVGYLVSEDNANAVYPAAPANFLLEEHVNASNGRYYHAIMHGRNVMGGYSDKLSYEERWQVIHYIRSLQAKEAKLTYNAEENTLNAAHGTPLANTDIPTRLQAEAAAAAEAEEEENHDHDHDHGDHSHDHDHDDHK